MIYTFFASMGSNMGNPLLNIQEAVTQLSTKCEITKISSVWKTQAWGLKEQDDFLNMVVYGKTKLTPIELLYFFQQIEKNLGRIKNEKWGPRMIDLDILEFNSMIIKSENLIIPHPHIEKRNFVLKPWFEIAPDYVIPTSCLTVSELLNICSDESKIEIFKENLFDN